VVTGDAIILRGGTYRTGGLVLNQGVTIQPYQDENPVLKGTEVADKWEPLRDGVWRTKWTALFPCKPRDWWQRKREGTRTPMHRFNNDMVFIDGRALQSAGWEGELTADTYFIDYEGGYVFIKNDPTGHLVEITARDSALVCTAKPAHGKDGDHKGPAIRGLTFTQYAYRALEVEGKRGSVPPTEEPTDDPIGLADPATFGKEVVGTLLENCTVTHCSRVGGYFRGDRLVIRQCLFSDTSTEGIYVIGSSDCLLERNIIARNNVEQLTGYYPSAVKIFNQTRRVVCRDNLITDNPNSNGVWYDVGNVDGVFVNNWVEGCLDGFFFEISKGVTVAGNVFANCTNGIRILNSSGAKVWHNTFVNATATFERNERSAAADHFGWHPSTGPDVTEREGHVFSGNLLVAGATYPRALLRAWQSPVLKAKLTAPMFTATDANCYVRPAGVTPALVTWSPGAGDLNQFDFSSLAGLQSKLPAFEAHSRQLAAEPGAVLQSPELKNFRPINLLPVEAAVPAEVTVILGWPPSPAYLAGAYSGK
jgi:parallel beta-helix repeat protein